MNEPDQSEPWELAYEAIEDKLEPDERVLWAGMPRQGVIWRLTDVPITVIALIFLAFAFWWYSEVIMSLLLWGDKIPLECKIAFIGGGLLFILLLLFVLLLGHRSEARIRARTFYLLTDRRALFKRTRFRTKFQALVFSEQQQITLFGGDAGEGTLMFGALPKWFPFSTSRVSFGDQLQEPHFLRIPRAKQVRDLILSLQGQSNQPSRDSWQYPSATLGTLAIFDVTCPVCSTELILYSGVHGEEGNQLHIHADSLDFGGGYFMLDCIPVDRVHSGRDLDGACIHFEGDDALDDDTAGSQPVDLETSGWTFERFEDHHEFRFEELKISFEAATGRWFRVRLECRLDNDIGPIEASGEFYAELIEKEFP